MYTEHQRWNLSRSEATIFFILIEFNKLTFINATHNHFSIGDSGGGVVVNNTLVGIVSSSKGCAAGFPDVHTNVYSFLAWIDQMSLDVKKTKVEKNIYK